MPIDTSQIKRICVIQLGRLGDVFLSTSYFEALKRQIPGVHITFLVKAPNHRILRDHPFIDELFIIPKAKGWQYAKERIRTFKKMANSNFDLVLDHQYKPSSMNLARISGAKYRIGLNGDRFTIPFSYTHTVPYNSTEYRYSATQKFDVLAPLGITPEPYKMYLNITEAEQQGIDDWLTSFVPEDKPIIVLSPGSTSDFKCWNKDGFAQVADHFAKQGYEPIIIWGPSEEPIVEAVLAAMQEKGTMAIPTTPQEAVALLKRAALFITNDGGITHLSVAAEVKTVTIFAGTQPTTWAPQAEFSSHRHLYNAAAEKGDAYWGVSSQEVIELAEKLITEQ